MAITAAMVKELRESTGAGMMECKKALSETNGDMDAAVEYLRKNGAMKAEKKASRIAAEGLTRVAVKDDKTAAVVEVNSETDFVAQNEKFQNFVEAVAKQAVLSDAKDMDAFLAEPWVEDKNETVKEALVAITAVISEKLSIRRFEKLTADNGIVVPYVHGGGFYFGCSQRGCEECGNAGGCTECQICGHGGRSGRLQESREGDPLSAGNQGK